MCRVIHNALFFLSVSSGSFLWGQGTQTALCRESQLKVNKEEIGRRCWRERGRELQSQIRKRKEKAGEQSSSKRRLPQGGRDDSAVISAYYSLFQRNRDYGFPAPLSCVSQLPVTPIPGRLTPSSGICGYLQIHGACSQTQTHTNIHISKSKY